MFFVLQTANVTADAKNCVYPNRKEITTGEALKDAVRFDHVCGEFRKDYRNISNFLKSNVIVMDCDLQHPVSVIPERFGGSSAADNQVTVPVAAARRKNEADIMVEALFTLGQVQNYDCKFTYHEGKPNYLFMVARNGQETVFADSVRLL